MLFILSKYIFQIIFFLPSWFQMWHSVAHIPLYFTCKRRNRIDKQNNRNLKTNYYLTQINGLEDEPYQNGFTEESTPEYELKQVICHFKKYFLCSMKDFRVRFWIVDWLDGTHTIFLVKPHLTTLTTLEMGNGFKTKVCFVCCPL